MISMWILERQGTASMPLRQNRPGWALTILTAAHLAVDLACFYLLYGSFRPQLGDMLLVSQGFLLYNVIAFGLQPLVGSALDRRWLPAVAPVSCLLIVLGLLLAASRPWLGLGVAALGNAGFHAAGGLLSLAFSQGRAARPGVFVSSGAVGVSCGIVLAARSFPRWPVLALLILVAVLLCLCPRPQGQAIPFEITFRRLPFGWLLAVILLAVFIRALAGGLTPMSWRSGDLAILLAGVAAAAGKALGGFAGDCFGFRPTALVSLLLSLPMLAFGGQLMGFSLAGLVLFNMAMPLTLCAAAALLPRDLGLAFGLTTLALLLGTVPLFFFELTPDAAPLAVAAAGLIAVASLALAFAPRRK